jgi:hypothetical protein
MLVGCATAVSIALNVAHAPDRLSAQSFAALPPVALLGALELLMSVAHTGFPHTHRTTVTQDRSSGRENTAAPAGRPQLPAPDHHPAAGNGSGPSLTAALGCVSWSPPSAPPAPASMPATWRPRSGSANAPPMNCSARSGLKTSSHDDPLPGLPATQDVPVGASHRVGQARAATHRRPRAKVASRRSCCRAG